MDAPTPTRKPYPTDVSDGEGAFVAPSLRLMDEAAPQRRHALGEVVNGRRSTVRGGRPWRLMPHGLPPWPVVYRRTRRWMAAASFEAIVHDLRALRRLGAGRAPEPTAAILDSRTLQATPASGRRAGYDGAKRRKGPTVHAAVDTLGRLLALHLTPADEQDRAQLAELAEAIQEATGQRVAVACVDQGYTGDQAAADAAAHGIRLEVVELPGGERGSVLLPRRWVVERSFAWTGRFRRLARDYGRLQTALEGVRCVAFALPALHQALPVLAVLCDKYDRITTSETSARSP